MFNIASNILNIYNMNNQSKSSIPQFEVFVEPNHCVSIKNLTPKQFSIIVASLRFTNKVRVFEDCNTNDYYFGYIYNKLNRVFYKYIVRHVQKRITFDLNDELPF